MSSGIRLARWDDLPKEKVTDTISRRLFTGKRMMIAHVYLDKGAIVPTHQHENEQISYILGEVLYLPSNVPHKAEALEDTLDVDIFDPPRQDWLDGTDTYFHKK